MISLVNSALLGNTDSVKKNNARLNYFFDVCANPRNGSDKIILTFGEPVSGKEEWIVMSYDPVTEQRKILAHINSRQLGATLVSLGSGEVMIVGGEGVDYLPSSSVEVFFCRQRQSRLVASLNVARSCHGACAVVDVVVVCGGRDRNWDALDSCEVFSEGRWSLLPDMKEARKGVTVISSPDRRIFAIGGRNGEGDCLSSVEFCRLPVDFDSLLPPPANFWNSLASMREARQGHNAVLVEGIILVAGGFGAEDRISSVEILSIANKKAQWVSLRASMNEKRGYFCLVAASEELFAFGNNAPIGNSVEQLQLKRTQNPVTSSSLDFLPEDLFSSQWEPLSPITSMRKVLGAIIISRASL